jgi:membrane protease YdiL (CAAX protease family)
MIAPEPLDLWNIGHALVGLSMGVFQLKRWFAYPLKIVWEIYQVFVHYGPYDIGFDEVWVNSVLDTAVFAVVYEVSWLCAKRVAKTGWWRRINPRLKAVAAFLILTFGGSFVMGWDLKPSIAPDLLQITTVIFPMVLCPAIAAFMVRGLITREGFSDVCLSLKIKQAWPVYLAALVVPAVVAVSIEFVSPTAYSIMPEWLRLPFLGRAGNSLQFIVLTVIMTPLLFGQEFGWRSYLQPRLFDNKPLLSSVLTGCIWGLWLFTVTWRAYRLSGTDILGLSVIPLITIVLSIILGWFYSIRSNVWATSIVHSAVAVVGGSLIYAPVYVKAKVVYVSAIGIWVLIPVCCVGLWILFKYYRHNQNIGT